jgi:hypothetical protein
LSSTSVIWERILFSPRWFAAVASFCSALLRIFDEQVAAAEETEEAVGDRVRSRMDAQAMVSEVEDEHARETSSLWCHQIKNRSELHRHLATSNSNVPFLCMVVTISLVLWRLPRMA